MTVRRTEVTVRYSDQLGIALKENVMRTTGSWLSVLRSPSHLWTNVKTLKKSWKQSTIRATARRSIKWSSMFFFFGAKLPDYTEAFPRGFPSQATTLELTDLVKFTFFFFSMSVVGWIVSFIIFVITKRMFVTFSFRGVSPTVNVHSFVSVVDCKQCTHFARTFSLSYLWLKFVKLTL